MDPINESVWDVVYVPYGETERPGFTLTPAALEEAAKAPLEDEVQEFTIEGEMIPFLRIINHVDLDEEN